MQLCSKKHLMWRNWRGQRLNLLLSVGGDALSCIAGALAEQGQLWADSAGTGNDFARTYQIPADPQAAMQIILAGHTVNLDLGIVNGRYFYKLSAPVWMLP